MLLELLTLALASTGVVIDELVPLFPDGSPARAVSSLDAPRGGIAGVHVVVGGLDAEAPLILSVRGGDELPSPRWYRLIDVPVEENTGLGSRTERFKGDVNPHVIRRAPFRVYEVMQPLDGGIAGPEDALVLRVEWEVPLVSSPGVHDVEIVIEQHGGALVLPLRVTVHAAAVPPAGAGTLGYTNWFSPGNVASYHDLELWSEPYWDMLAKYAALMHRGRQNMFWVRWPDFFTEKDGRWVLDESRLVRYIDLFTDAGLHWIEGAPFAGRPGGDWGSPVLELKLGGTLMTGAAGQAAFAEQSAQVWDAIERHGWAGRWVQHIADEPTDVNAADYAIAAAMVRKRMPGIPIFEATMSRELTGAVDMWCPQVQAWHGERTFFDDRGAAGDRVWVYTCLRPGGPWLNRLLDQERVRQVYFGWLAARGGLAGYLHWGLNHWKADPFARSVVDHPAMPGTDNRLPAGDTHVVYPGDGAPWSGQRFEAHRIGMEDHALLMQLSAESRGRLVDRVIRHPSDWEADIAAYRAARRALLEHASAATPWIEILGFPGCPMTPEITASVRAAAGTALVVETDLSSLPANDERLRWPAPTVLVGGLDLFGASPAAAAAIACRVYPGGIPDEDAVAAALAQRLRGYH